LDLNSTSDVTYEWLDSSSLAHGALLLGGKYYLKRIPLKLLVELCGMSPGTSSKYSLGAADRSAKTGSTFENVGKRTNSSSEGE